MEEGELLDILRDKSSEASVERGLSLANGGVRLEKDHRMVRGKGGIQAFKDFGVASISRTESKVEFRMDSPVPKCGVCPLSAGAICHHLIAAVIAINRQGFLDDDALKTMVEGMYRAEDRGSSAAMRVCPNCKKPLDINAQVICPECGRGVCRNCYREEDRMCTKCYKIKVLGERPQGGLLDSIKGFFSRG